MSDSAIQYLLSRRSVKFVQTPGPDDDELALILQTAMRAPDHGRLRPWRFKILRNDAIQKLADLAIRATREAGIEMTAQKEETTRRWLKEVPLMLAVACHIDHSNTRIPEDERLLATGAAVTNILNAAHMLGYAAYWSTGLGTYVDEVNEALGFDSLDYRFMGYVVLGTPIQSMTPPERPDYREFVSEWTGSK
ncbi:MAG TPA: nitroreductase [Burkholderiaceae bacterium]|nr:nitroreductase [Burkholderiaceae bacterium]